MPWQHYNDLDLIIKVRIQPRASKDEITGLYQERIKIRIKAPPVDGKANRSLQAMLAKDFGVSKNKVNLIQGEHSQDKTIAIQQPKTVPTWFNELGGSITLENGD